MKVLIIDDEPEIVAMYRDKLTTEGFTVTTAANAKEGLAKVHSNSPDVILLDLLMPSESGMHLLEELKSDPATAHIVIYLLTNIPAELMAKKAEAAGAAGYFFKAEVEPKEVVKVLSELQKKTTNE